MLFKSKAFAVFFLAVISSSQANSASSPIVAQSDRFDLASASSLIESDRVSSITASGQMYGISAESLSDGAVANAGDSLIFPALKEVQSSAELKVGEIVISDSTVPEPESYAMFLAGLGIIAAMVRRRSASV